MRRLLPLVVGLLAAASVFGLVALAGDDGDGGDDRAVASGVDGRSVFVRMGCGGCHRLAAAGARGQEGPDLDRALSAYDRASLTKQIVNPRGSEGFATMPANFGERLTADELSALVTFLLESRR